MILKLFKSCLILTVSIGLLFTFACKKSSDVENVSREEVEQVATHTASVVADLFQQTFQSISDIVNAGGEVPAGYSYDAATGWWSFTLFLEIGQDANIQFKFLDASEGSQKFFGPDTTYIASTGQSNGIVCYFYYDVTVTVGEDQTYVINGNGVTVYKDIREPFTIENLVLKSSSSVDNNTYPSSGRLISTVGGVTVDISFIGTELVQISYTVQGVLYTITFNLVTFEIT